MTTATIAAALKAGDGMVCTERGELIAVVPYRPVDLTKHTEREMYSRLFAAAPELLAACEDAIDTLQRVFPDKTKHTSTPHPSVEMLRDAIRKARGEH